MKKSISIILSAIMLVLSVQICFADEAEAPIVFEKAESYGETLASADAEAWGNYLFIPNAKGVNIYGTSPFEKKAAWGLTSLRNKLPSKMKSTYVPYKMKVNDKYIAAAAATKSNASSIAVFENPGIYTDTTPKLKAAIGGFNIPKIYIDEGNLYVFDIAAKEIQNADGETMPKGTKLFIKIDINAVTEAYGDKYAEIGTDTDLYETGACSITALSKADSFWEKIIKTDDAFYAVSYNNVTAAPYTTLKLNRIGLDGGVSEKIIADGHPTGLRILNSEAYDSDVLSAATVGVKEYPELSISLKTVGYLTEDYENENGERIFNIYIDITGMNKIVAEAKKANVQLNINDMKNANLTVTLNMNETSADFAYSENNKTYTLGTMTEKNGLIYAVTNDSKTTNNSLWIFKANESMETVFEGVPCTIGKKNGMQDIFVAGNLLVGLISGVNNSAVTFDISDPSDMSMNCYMKIEIKNAGISNGINLGAHTEKIGNRIYYPLMANSGMGVMKINEKSFTLDVHTSNYGSALIYGDNTESDTAEIIVDGISCTANSENGAYILPIYRLGDGTHEVTVKSGENTLSKSFETVNSSIGNALEIDSVKYAGSISGMIKNNTDTVMNGTENIRVVAASFKEDGSMNAVKEATVAVNCGASKKFTLTRPALLNKDDEVYVCFMGNNGLLTAPYVMSTAGIFHEEKEYSGKAEMIADTAFEAKDNIWNKCVNISGYGIAGDYVLVEMLKGKVVHDISIVKCDENGYFESVFSYADKDYKTTDEFTVNTYIARAGLKTTVLKFNDKAKIDETVAALKAEDVSALKAYAEENADEVKKYGIDITNEAYGKLTEENKLKVMQAVSDKIKAGEYDSIRNTFEALSEEYAGMQSDEDALKEIREVKAADVRKILEKYKDKCGISDKTWERYDSLERIVGEFSDKKFAEGEKPDKFDEVEPLLIKAMDAAEKEAKEITEKEKNNSKPSGGSSGGSGGGSGKSMSGYQTPIVPIEKKEPLADNAVMPSKFKDISDDNWAKESIDSLASKGIVNGVTEDTFAPDDNVTREQFVQMLVKAFDIKAENSGCSFADVDTGAWYVESVAAAEAAGIVMGSDGKFGIGEEITRQDAAVIAYRTLKAVDKKLNKTKEGVAFDDADLIAEYAAEAVNEMACAEIINGIGENMFAPNDKCTRAMAAKIIYLILNNAA